MPLLRNSRYRPPLLFRNPHFNTVYPALFRQVNSVHYERERLETPDGDFLDLDWSRAGSRRLLIALHGLEGAADRPYIRGLVRLFNRHRWDALGFNFRGCSGEPNRLLRSYHMGETSDLDWVIGRILELDRYDTIVVAGFSLGGNVALKYAGERGDRLPRQVRRIIAFSVPCHIASANVEIDRWHNRLYLRRFLRSLRAKMEEKAKLFPGKVDLSGPRPHNFRTFDDRFTAPLHGFRDAEDYWAQCSSLQFLSNLSVPTLLLSARDDTFLSEQCYPAELADRHPFFYLEAPRYGGHVGFVTGDPEGVFWSEKRALDFAEADVWP